MHNARHCTPSVILICNVRHMCTVLNCNFFFVGIHYKANVYMHIISITCIYNVILVPDGLYLIV